LTLVAAIAALWVLTRGDGQASSPPAGPSTASAAAHRFPRPGPARLFATPAEAAQGLAAAWRSGASAEILSLFGPAGEALVRSGDRVADHRERQWLADAYDAAHSLQLRGAREAVLLLGHDQWPYPVPMVRVENGWRFDAAAGAREIIDRRIGRNELHVIAVLRTIVEAERDYAAQAPAGAPRAFAARITSSAGQHDGLYWPTSETETASPLGPLVAAAEAHGLGESVEREFSPFHGYYFNILTRQGSDAPGGAKSYLQDGRLSRGFGVVAWPAIYGDSGVMTFIVNQDGIVFQKNFGPQTRIIARQIFEYDPDGSWRPAPP
jgi:hypothetical protein